MTEQGSRTILAPSTATVDAIGVRPDPESKQREDRRMRLGQRRIDRSADRRAPLDESAERAERPAMIGKDVMAVQPVNDRQPLLQRVQRFDVVRERQLGKRTGHDLVDPGPLFPSHFRFDFRRHDGPRLQALALQHEDEPLWHRLHARSVRFQLP